MPLAGTEASNRSSSSCRSLAQNIAALDPDGGALTFVLEEALVGMTWRSATGRLHWLPSAAHVGKYEVAFRVVDSIGPVARQRCTLGVAGAPAARMVDIGGTVQGTLSSGGLEAIVIAATAESSVSFRGLTMGGNSAPRVELIDPAGRYLELRSNLTTSPVGNLVTVAELPLTQLGRWTLRVFNDAPAAGQAGVRLRFAP